MAPANPGAGNRSNFGVTHARCGDYTGTANIVFTSLAISGSCGASVKSACTETAERHREPQSHQPGLRSHGPSLVLRGPNNWIILVYKGLRRHSSLCKNKIER